MYVLLTFTCVGFEKFVNFAAAPEEFRVVVRVERLVGQVLGAKNVVFVGRQEGHVFRHVSLVELLVQVQRLLGQALDNNAGYLGQEIKYKWNYEHKK